MKNNKNNISLFIACTIIVNAANYGLNIFLGRYLGPEAFAEANVLATMVLLLSFLATGWQMTVSKYVAEANTAEEREQTANWFHSVIFRTGLVLTAILLLAAPSIQNYLKFESMLPIILMIVSIPFYFKLSINRGVYQGNQEFGLLAKTFFIEMLIRVVLTIAGLIACYQLGHLYFSEVIAAGFLLSFAGSFILTQTKKVITASNFNLDKRLIWNFLAVIIFYELSQILINNSDIILVKHFFNDTDAGLYAGISILGKGVYFATWTLVMILFPKVIQMEKEGKNHAPLFWKNLILVAAIGASISLTFLFFGDWMVGLIFGNEYSIDSSLLSYYAWMTSLFACCNVFAYYHMSLNRYLPVAFSCAGGILQIVLIQFFHESMWMVVNMQMITVSSLVIVLIAYHFGRAIPTNFSLKLTSFKPSI